MSARLVKTLIAENMALRNALDILSRAIHSQLHPRSPWEECPDETCTAVKILTRKERTAPEGDEE